MPDLSLSQARIAFAMGSSKVPGIDGYHTIFFQTHWEIVGEAVCSMVKDIFNGEQLEKMLIVLISKVAHLEKLS